MSNQEEANIPEQFSHSVKLSETAKEYQRKWQEAHRQKVKDTPEFKQMKKISDQKYHEKIKNRMLKHNGKQTIITKERKGICEWCGAIKGQNCKQTQLHHLKYDESDLSLYTVELCASCHRKESTKKQGKKRLSEIGKIARASQKYSSEFYSKIAKKGSKNRKWVYNRATGKLQIRRGYNGN